MPDLHYEHPQLAQMYDITSGWSKERDFYVSLANPNEPQDILDFGCGTGLICNVLAEQGHRVTGVDPAAAMLDVARNTPHGDKIEWVQATAQNFQGQKRFDLIIMTGNAFQVLLTEEDLLLALHTVRSQLKPGGCFAFETRNPELDWVSNWHTDTTFTAPGNLVVREERRVLEKAGDLLHFKIDYSFSEQVLTSRSTIRFWAPEEIQKNLDTAGLEVRELYGDWDGDPFNPETTEEMVFLVRIKA